MNELDDFGLTEKEKGMNLHEYNHALFRNMMFFMDIVWEINVLTDTVVILVDKDEPDRGGTQLLYQSVYGDYMENRIDQEEQALFEQHMSPENLKELKEEVNFDVSLHMRSGKQELHRIVLTPSFDGEGQLSCVYLGARNLQEEVRQQAALKEAYETANRASAAKTDFLTRISHDIRTPMNAIIGMTAIAEKHQDNKERVEGCLKKISVSSKYLLALLDEMLDMSMIESGKLLLQEEEIDLVKLFENLNIILGGQVREYGHEFNASVLQVNHRKVLGDRKRIDQIVMNLVDNAVKYTLEGGNIRMTLEEKPTNKPDIGCYEIVVMDNGIGMSQETLRHLFEPFVRAKDRRVERIPGSGLGLAITNNIVKMLNGAIEVESRPEEGTKVTARIFLKLQAKRDTSLAKIEAEARAEDKTPIEALTEKDFSGYRVLMVEDNESNADIIREILEMVGLKVEHAWNGVEAVEMIVAAKDWYYSVVFMDIQMPTMDGYEATKAIRRLNSTYAKEVPILAMSANAFAEDVQASLSAGMNEHISKPVDFRKLGDALTRWLPNVPLPEDRG